MASDSAGWDLYRSFLSVLRRGSLSAGARALGLTQPTLGRHIAELEAKLGVSLFVRSQSGLSPTAASLALKPHAEAMEAAAAALIRAVSGAMDEPTGTVRLTASEFIGVEVLPPILTIFREAHPNIAIELALSNLNQDLLRRDADIAVRMMRPTQSALVARRLGQVGIGLYAHRSYLARHGMPARLADLANHTLIGFDADTAALRAYRQTGIAVTRDLFALRTDSEHAQLAALRSGYGIGGCQKGVAARNPGLVPVLPREFGAALEMWLVMHEDLRTVRRVRLLYDHLADALGGYAAERQAVPQSAKKPRKIRPERGSSRSRNKG